MLWEEMTSKDLEKARELAGGICIIPFGVIEKHGQHLPLCTDMIISRKLAEKAAEIEPAVIFPYFFFGQINEGRHLPGTIAITPGLMYSLLEEVCNEVSRNGFKKIIILNSHGGNYSFVNYFIQSSLYSKRDYILYSLSCLLREEDEETFFKAMGTDDMGEHAGNMETSIVMASRPELVKMDEVNPDESKPLGRLNHFKDIFTSVLWYSNYPAHFAGNPSKATPESGELAIELIAKAVAREVKAIKEDQVAKQLQDEFFSKTSIV